MPSKKCSYNQWPRDELDPLVAAEDGRVFGEVVHEGHPTLVGQLPDRVGALESFLHNLKLKQILIDLSSDERQVSKPFLQFFFLPTNAAFRLIAAKLKTSSVMQQFFISMLCYISSF